LKFPRYDLNSSLEVAQRIHDRAGGEASADAAAEFLGYKSKNNGAFLSRLASARLFGLIEGSASRLNVTPRALEILQPDYPQTRSRALIEAFEAVPLFGAFLRAYEGQPLPDEVGMRNALKVKFGLKDDATTSRALARLLDSAETAGLFQVAGARTKLIRPTDGSEALTSRSDEREEKSQPATGPSPSVQNSTLLRLPKVIEGALEEVPWNEDWDEDAIDEWITWFRGALRMHFKFPRQGGSPAIPN
jgi:hypothetical protein